MTEKLLNLQDVANYLSLSQEQVKELVSKGILPGYRIAGSFLRFNKDEVDLAKPKVYNYISNLKKAGKKNPVAEEAEGEATLGDRIIDFLYFNSFYIIATIVVAIVLALIFR